MVYNLISAKTVIAKVFSDLGLQEEQVPITDIMNWIGEALSKIGAVTTLTNKVTGKEGIPLLQIENYQARLPMDCHNVQQIAYATSVDSTVFYPMKYATGTFEGRQGLTSAIENTYITGSNLGVVLDTENLIRLTMALYDITYDEAVVKLNDEPEITSIIENLIGSSATALLDGGTVNEYQLEYKIVPNYIKTNAKEGYLMVSYNAIPTDCDGYPMIPDNESFMDAIFWYINMKLLYIDWRTGTGTKEMYYDAKNTWNFYVKQAYGNALMPASLDEMESIKNAWVRLLPNMNAGDNFFKYMDQQEQIKTFS